MRVNRVKQAAKSGYGGAGEGCLAVIAGVLLCLGQWWSVWTAGFMGVLAILTLFIDETLHRRRGVRSPS